MYEITVQRIRVAWDSYAGRERSIVSPLTHICAEVTSKTAVLVREKGLRLLRYIYIYIYKSQVPIQDSAQRNIKHQSWGLARFLPIVQRPHSVSVADIG